jgi:hypothetical protein
VQASAKTVAFRSNLGLDEVIVKGGPAANIYTYAKGTSGSGLHAPVNPSGGWAGLSHVDFCYGRASSSRRRDQAPASSRRPSSRRRAGRRPTAAASSSRRGAQRRHARRPLRRAGLAAGRAGSESPARASFGPRRPGPPAALRGEPLPPERSAGARCAPSRSTSTAAGPHRRVARGARASRSR